MEGRGCLEGEELEANRRAWVTGEQKRQRQQATGTTVRRVDPHRAEKEQEQTQPMGGEGRSRRGRWRTEEVAARGTSETGDRYAGQQQRGSNTEREVAQQQSAPDWRGRTPSK